MNQDVAIYKNILDNMHGGVLTVGLDGRILTFNPGAARILGIARDEVVGHIFAEVFLAREGMGAFAQAIMDAIYEAEVEHQRMVEVRYGGNTVSLAMTTSYLQSVRDGEVKRIGVIAIFSDITEIKALREAELRLAETAKAQHAQLQEAYRRIEANNQALASATKRERIAVVAIVALFLAAGLFVWETEPLMHSPGTSPSVSEASASAEVRTVRVTPQPLASTITVSGQLVPRQEVQVVSPISGTVAATHFQYGAQVTRGQRLVDLDTTEIESKYRQAQAQYIKALQHFNELEDWENNVEVARVRRAISKTKLQLETQKQKRDETAFLLERGVIPAAEHEAAEQQLRNLQLDYEASQQDLESVLAKGGAEEKQVAQLELDNARTQLRTLEDTLQGSVVHAPVAGVILQPRRSGGGKPEQGGERLTKGRPVTQGALLLTIGDLDGLSVTGTVDEVDITKVRLGQPVDISGDAFPGLALKGTMSHVSAQAGQTGQGKNTLPMFEITVTLENLTPAQRRQLRLGMSANLEVVVYEKPDALLVPFSTVQTRNGKAWLRVKDKETGEVKQIEVDTGVTTLDAVEIVRGLEPGDEVVLSGV